MQKVVWARVSVSMPEGSPRAENSSRKATPRMISGSMVGSTAIFSISPWPARSARPRQPFFIRARACPSAPSTPSTVASVTLHAASTRLFFSASPKPRSSENSARYHCRENPVNTVGVRAVLALKENNATTKMGRYSSSTISAR